MKIILTLGLISLITSISIYASDINKGKEKSAVCAGCHGVNGIGLSQEFPNLAGQKQVYIVK